MSFDTISALEIPQQATELTTEELKQICGGKDSDFRRDEDADRRRRRHNHHHCCRRDRRD